MTTTTDSNYQPRQTAAPYATPTNIYAALRVARQVARYASSLDAQGNHDHADMVDAAMTGILRRMGASWINNGYNAVQMGLHAGEPLYLLGTMNTQVRNLMQTVVQQRGELDPNVQGLAEKLVQNVQAWLAQVQNGLFTSGTGNYSGVGASPSSPTPQPSPTTAKAHNGRQRLANAESTVESNARAALGVMAYLDREDVFPQGPQALQAITRDIDTLVALVTGGLTPESVQGYMAGGQGRQQAISKDDNPKLSPEQSEAERMRGMARGVRWSLGNDPDLPGEEREAESGEPVGTITSPPASYNEAHIQRYLAYMQAYGYDAMVKHLHQYEGDPNFVRAVGDRARAIARLNSR